MRYPDAVADTPTTSVTSLLGVAVVAYDAPGAAQRTVDALASLAIPAIMINCRAPRSTFPRGTEITPGNIGYGAAYNLAVHRLMGRGVRWIAFLNDDVEFTPSDYEELTRRLAAAPERAAVLGLEFDDGAAGCDCPVTPNTSLVELLLGHHGVERWHKGRRLPDPAAFVVRVSALRHVGGFPSSRFRYFEVASMVDAIEAVGLSFGSDTGSSLVQKSAAGISRKPFTSGYAYGRAARDYLAGSGRRSLAPLYALHFLRDATAASYALSGHDLITAVGRAAGLLVGGATLDELLLRRRLGAEARGGRTIPQARLAGRPPRVTLAWHGAASMNIGLDGLGRASQMLIDETLGIPGQPSPVRAIVADGVGPTPGDTPIRIGAQAKTILPALLGVGPLASLLRDTDLFIDAGAGDSFTDLYGRRRLLKQVALKWAARRAGAMVVMAPQTVGPFSRFLSPRLASFGFSAVDEVFVRDAPSKIIVASITGSDRAHIAPDLVSHLRPRGHPRVDSDPTGTVILNVSGLLWNGGIDGVKAADYREIVLQLAEALTTMGKNVQLLPHTRGAFIEDDEAACQALAKATAGLTVLEAPSSFTDSQQMSKSSALVISARMHLCIAAILAGIPAIPLAYSDKFSGVLEELGYPIVIEMRNRKTQDIVEEVLAMSGDLSHLRCQLDLVAERSASVSPYVSFLRSLR